MKHSEERNWIFKSQSNTGIIYCLLICMLMVTVPIQTVAAADIDGDGRSDSIETCDGNFNSGALLGSCDSPDLCDAHRDCVQTDGIACACNGDPISCTELPGGPPGVFCDPDTDSTCNIACAHTHDFDCDNETDSAEYAAGNDPTDPASNAAGITPHDTDGDGVADNRPGFNCDKDDDNDALLDESDMCPRTPLSGQPIPANNIDIGCDLICMRPSIGVPGQPAPRIPTIDGAVAEDVGWRGAHRITFNNGTTAEHVAFQGLRDNRGDSAPENAFFYMSFEVKNDDGGASEGDTVVLTFRPSFDTSAVSFPAGNAANDIRLFIYADMSSLPELSIHNGSIWEAKTTILPSNMEIVINPSPATDAWDVEIKMPITTAAGGTGWFDFGDYFKFYFNVIRETSPIATEFVWPDHGHRIGGDINSYVYDNHEWGIGTKDNAAKCHGVYLTASDIGTTNLPANSIVWPTPTNPDATNTFFANVKNLSWDSGLGDWSPANDINVRFRIADWGIAGVGDLTSTSWTSIRADNDECDTPDSNDNPTCDDNVTEATDAATPGEHTFNLDWKVNPTEQAKYDPSADPAGYDHQCILVELDSSSNANIITKSVHRNMNFSAAASVLERKAKIDARGLPKPPGGHGEHTFILQETRHELDPIRIKDMKDNVKKESRLTYNDGKDPQSIDEDEWLSRTEWLIHGYRETGNYVEVKDVKYLLTEPVSSFGYVVSHTGDEVDEWVYELKGDGIETISDGSHRMIIPKDGFMEIVTRIESVKYTLPEKLLKLVQEKPWLLIFIILLILYLLWRVMRKKNSSN